MSDSPRVRGRDAHNKRRADILGTMRRAERGNEGAVRALVSGRVEGPCNVEVTGTGGRFFTLTLPSGTVVEGVFHPRDGAKVCDWDAYEAFDRAECEQPSCSRAGVHVAATGGGALPAR